MWPLRLKELRKISGKTLTFLFPSLPLQALERKTCALGSFRMVSLLVQRVEHLDSSIDDFHETAVGIRNFLILETLFFAHKYFFYLPGFDTSHIRASVVYKLQLRSARNKLVSGSRLRHDLQMPVQFNGQHSSWHAFGVCVSAQPQTGLWHCLGITFLTNYSHW